MSHRHRADDHGVLVRDVWRLVGATPLLIVSGCALEADAQSPVVAGTAAPSVTSADGSRRPGTSDVDEPATHPSTADDLWTVVEVVDGDTIRVTGRSGEATVRLVGVNAPEVGECFYDEATAALRFTIGSGGVRLERDVSDVDQFDRWLRFVESPEGVDIGGELVAAGYVRSHWYEPDTSRNVKYDDLQSAAQDEGAGFWATDACGSGVASDTSIEVGGQFDAPGNDNLNLGEEWVTFTNTSELRLDLTGWRVADESSSHRYEFAALSLAPGARVTLFTGCGTDTDTARYWCNEDSAVWNNDGDTVFLTDPKGNPIATHTYRD
jgi:micrococcal nuclease